MHQREFRAEQLADRDSRLEGLIRRFREFSCDENLVKVDLARVQVRALVDSGKIRSYRFRAHEHPFQAELTAKNPDLNACYSSLNPESSDDDHR